MLLGIVTLGGLSLDHDGSVTFLIELRPVRDGPDDVTGTQSESCSEGGQCRNQYGDDDFDDLLFGHNGVRF